VQRFFSTFPGHWPGVGLLLLRSLLGIVASWQAMSYLEQAPEPTAMAWTAAVLAPISGVLLIAGGLTPASSAVAGMSLLIVSFTNGPSVAALLPLGWTGAVCMAVVAVALILLGPGALSIDARWFGRREIVFVQSPPRS
jgi:uncharacterized membrane protein YphA (DoxX/SURF4 family)